MFYHRVRLSAVALLVLLAPISTNRAQTPAPFQNDAATQHFVDDLLAKMTVEEKINQMEQAAGQPTLTPPAKANELARAGIGSFLFLTDPVRINELQKVATTESRLRIPLLFGYDVIHGFRTLFPIPLAMASSWDPQLAEHAQSMAAKEARASGIDWAFTPMVDIARDARWGRIMEGAGEDPFLGEQMAAAQVRGLQGDSLGAPDHLLACVKHFAGYGAAEGGRDYDSSDISDDLLWNVYLRPYRAAVNAGAATVMSAYMDLNSVPATGNIWLMQDVLRKQWGFRGFVVSDWDAVKSLQVHGFAADSQDAAVRAVKAGINMEMTSSVYRDNLPAAIKAGKVSVAEINELVRPILEMKYRLGLFKNPFVDLDRFQAITGSVELRQASLHAAEGSAVLLRNEDHVLPLRKDIASLAVIGPLADAPLDTMGSWSLHGDRNDTVTIAAGLREKLPQTKIAVTTGVEIDRTNGSIFDAQTRPSKPKLLTESARKAEFEHALELARTSDETILVLGENQNMSGERASRASLDLPGQQEALLEAVVALHKPVILVLMTGRPLNITWASEHVSAILNAWYPGTEGGHAVANLLTGDADPSGHLTVSWPRNAGQEPLYYNDNLTQIPEDRDQRYWDKSSAPLYPFGYGLSYASFTMDTLTLKEQTIPLNGVLEASVKLTNTSGVGGQQVVQLYTHQRAGSASRPVRELKAFEKVALTAGESRSVTLRVPASELQFWSPALHKVVLEPGTFDVWVGDSSAASLHTTFTLTQ